MRYTGNVLIFDEEGNTVFDRELTEDEIVEAVLAAISDAPDEAEEEAEVEAAADQTPAASKRGRPKRAPDADDEDRQGS
jgi:hypothetical protein